MSSVQIRKQVLQIPFFRGLKNETSQKSIYMNLALVKVVLPAARLWWQTPFLIESLTWMVTTGRKIGNFKSRILPAFLIVRNSFDTELKWAKLIKRLSLPFDPILENWNWDRHDICELSFPKSSILHFKIFFQ